MHQVPFGALRRGFAVAAVAASVSLGVAACNDSASIDPQRDRFLILLIQRTGLQGGSDGSEFRRAFQEAAFPTK